MAIVFLDSELSGLYSVKLTPGEEVRIFDKMEKIKAVTIGLIVAIRDHERKSEAFVKAYPFLKGEQAVKWLSEVLDRAETRAYVQ